MVRGFLFNMDRLALEKEVFQNMAELTAAGALRSTVADRLRLYVQGKIQAATDDICQDSKWKFRQKSWAIYIKAPLTGTANITKGGTTSVVTGQTPDNTWIGCAVVIGGNGFPLIVQSVSGQTLTFQNVIMASTNSAASFTVYFCAALSPTDFKMMKANTMLLDGSAVLSQVSPEDMPWWMGYFGATGNDYGFPTGVYRRTVQEPTIGEPYSFSSWDYITLSGVQRKVITLYPFPDRAYSLSWKGWRKPTAIAIAASSTNDADVPDIPEDFHRSLLVPRLLMLMSGYPGFELSQGELAIQQANYRDALVRFRSEQQDDEHDFKPMQASRFTTC